MTTPYIAATVPAKTDHVSNTTLFRLAMHEFGDALQWPAIAALNGMIDPWIVGQANVLIPPVLPTGTPTGILSPTIGGATAAQ
jgi:hypothetical protein